MTMKRRTAALALWCCLWTGGAQAEGSGEHGVDYLSAQLGAFDTGAFDGGNRLAAGFGIEYRAGVHLWWIHPFVGIMATSRGTVYGYGGILIDIPVGARVYLTPSAAVGGYSRGNGQDLGHAIEFRLGLEVSYRFDGGTRLGLRFQHMSNANIGSRNTGSESFFLTYSLPFSKLFGK